MKTSIETSIETITPQLAKDILANNRSNRSVNATIVAHYADAISRGQWELNGEALKIAHDGRLLDGQHRLMAVIKSGIPIQTLVIRGLSSEVFDTLDQGRARTGGDLLSSMGVSHANSVSSIILMHKSLDRGVAIGSKTGHKVAKMTKRDILEEYKSKPHFWNTIVEFARKMYLKKRLFTTSEIGGISAYLILNKNHRPSDVYSFFTQLFSRENVENSTITILHDKIVDSVMAGYKMDKNFKHALLVKTWNCYITGRVLKVLRMSKDEQIPTYL